MADSSSSISRWVRYGVSLTINTAVAVFGTGAMETAFGVFFHPRSILLLLWKASGLSVLFGLFLGVVIYRIFMPAAARWAWILPALWFCWRVLLFVGPGASFGHIWRQMSGTACISAAEYQGCGISFFVFTMPLIRAIAYAAGATAAMLILKPEPAAAP